jgi:hypothetical protein
MSKLVIGIDPDSEKHGVSIYIDKKIEALFSITLIDLLNLINGQVKFNQSINEIEIHIEDVCANSAVFRGGHSVSVQQSLARRLGKCQQSQVEVERMAEHLGVKVVKHKISKKWKCAKIGKAEFERVTGWIGRSNEDTRSAAWFGFLGCN